MSETLNTTVTYYNPLTSILSIASIIGMWKIFEDRGEKGWKSLVPFLNTLTFGRVCGEEERAKSLMIKNIILVLMFLIMLPIAAYILSISESSSVSSSSGRSLGIILLILLLAFLVLGIIAYVQQIKLFLAFDKVNEGPSWMIILWLLLPAGAYIYYAFIHKNVTILEEPEYNREVVTTLYKEEDNTNEEN